MGATTYWANKLLDATFRRVALTSPANVYMALYTTHTGDDGSGTEVTGGSYARPLVSTAALAAAASRQIISQLAVAYPNATADWGNCIAFAFHDNVTGGNMLWHDDLLIPRLILNGDIAPTFNIGQILLGM